jgi:hypothetical protein
MTDHFRNTRHGLHKKQLDLKKIIKLRPNLHVCKKLAQLASYLSIIVHNFFLFFSVWHMDGEQSLWILYL